MSKSLLYMLKVHIPIIWGWLGMGVDCGMKTLLGVLCVCMSHGRKKPYGQPGGKVTSAVQQDPRWPTEQFTYLTLFLNKESSVHTCSSVFLPRNGLQQTQCLQEKTCVKMCTLSG